jgi:putative membrane protein
LIVRPRPGALELLVILRGSVVPTIAPRVLAIVAFSAALALLHHLRPGLFRDLSAAPFTLLGLALSIFLGFRNNACYERWWEARRQWGQLIAEIRGFARDAVVLLPDPAVSGPLCRGTVAFAHALRDQLRREDTAGAAAWLAPGEWAEVARRRSPPDAIMRHQAVVLGALLREGALTELQHGLFSARMQAMTNIQTACERLSTTPTPFTYTLLLHRTAWMFCLLVPFGLVDTLGGFTPLATALLSYAFFGLDALGEELEEPFSRSQNGVPLDALVRAAEIATLECLGETVIPPPLQPHDYVLL